MKHRLLLLVALAVVASAVAAVVLSSANFTSQTTTAVAATADHIHNWLTINTPGSDPDNDTGYAYKRSGSTWTSTYAASSSNESVAVDLGATTSTSATSFTRVFKVKSVAAFPVTGVTTVTATVSIAPDPATGLQPIAGYGLMAWGTTSAAYTSTSPQPTISGWAVSTKKQLNLSMRFQTGRGFVSGTTYYPTITVALQYSGFTTTYYQYTVTLKYKYGT
jgi:hypothetical protein